MLMFVTEGAATMPVGRSTQEHGCNMIYVICKVHALHLVAETIRQCFPDVDGLMASSKKQVSPNIPEPPQQIPKRWGTWFEAASYYAKYFEQIEAVILEFSPNEAAAIKERQTKFQDISVETDLKTMFKY
ncbi:hypothetical protein NQ318_016904 [Aromia moschata]|uniref:Uncharacterized protein n=1 Tax=Aromia moschata TaxID=1265417 RepID=A0AAV8XSD2_9CUCU|nr:hypothetical protein NQ318_016904 [Aromia moschata]